EHKASLESCATLERAGMAVTRIPVGQDGTFAIEELERVLRQETVLVSIMAANNEIGTIAPLEKIGALCRDRKILFHTDAAQGAGKFPIDVTAMRIDLLSLTSHKMYGPKGVGALFVRRRDSRIPLVPQSEGGGHEHGYRSGTLNVPGIVGFGKAAEVAGTEMKDEQSRVARLRSLLVDGIRQCIPDLRVNGGEANRLPGNANLMLPGVMADQLMIEMKEVAVSAGSACSSSNPAPSHVLKSIGLTDEEARSSIRFGIGRFNTEEEIRYTVERIRRFVLENSPSIHQSAVS
ncbi:MAG: cysteine desulfurase, partial [Ignavibacteria bacterium]|nr:cysteine desulfurase [Ignavibacteria bacterium]